jgi:hypothetical protein
MNPTKIIALLLTAVMLVAALPACKGTTTDGTTVTTKSTAATTAAATTKTTTAATTKAETTAKETEAPKTYEYKDVFAIDFSKMPDGAAPFTVNGIDNLRIEGGLLKGTSNGGDPNFTYNGGDVNFAADTVQAIEIKYLNKSEDYAFQLFFTTDTITGFAENASFKQTLTYSAADGDKNEANVVQIDTSECTDWAGTITNFRMDPFSATGDFEVSYIKFMTKTEVKA